MAEKERIDVLLTEKDYFPSRNKAQRAIMAGEVKVDGKVVDKAGTQVDITADIEVKEKDRYVGRGAHKLAKALEHFAVRPVHKKALDIGSSTGGFTDCLLQEGADEVYAVDSGYNQLAWKLRQDDRVKVYERTNFRLLQPGDLPPDFDLIVCDVSFISLTLIIPVAAYFARSGAELITLVKPQFEAGPEKVGKGGVVRDPQIHMEVLNKVSRAVQAAGFWLEGLTYSPITGATGGNIEYLLHAKYKNEVQTDLPDSWDKQISKVVTEADRVLRG
ncbi:MAG: TlyA family RNA methyltransferase [Bacillota bacterium]